MKNYIVDLAKEYGLKGGTLECILGDFPWDCKEQCENWKRPAVIVVPGGGYGMVSKREGDPVAFEFLVRGFQAFILTYSIGGENGISYPEQLFQAAAAVDYIKTHAEELNVDKNAVFAVGFSAGGHLTANLAVEHQNVAQKLGRALDCKPTAVGLAYPVISYEDGHIGSYENLLYGYTDEAKAMLFEELSLEKRVSEHTPPAFLWTTAQDTCVPPSNTLRYASALNAKGIDYEVHIYPRLNHGASTGKKEINFVTPENAHDFERVSRWLDDCTEFFRMYVK